MKAAAGYAASLCILVLIICTSIIIPTFFIPFFSYEYDKNNVPETIGVEKEELISVTTELLDYMRGKRGDLIIYADINGEEREFFNDREKEHMADVLDLYTLLFRVRNSSIWLLIFFILLLVLLKAKVLEVLSRCCREVVVGFLLLAAVLAIVILLDFNRAFTVFHLLFFTNDLWILNPQTDLLINIVPQQFFIDIAIFIGGLLVLFSSLVILLGTLYLRYYSPAPKNRIMTKFKNKPD